MASWVEVARATMQYEWPDFELINSLGVFQTREGNHSSDERRLMLDRLVTPILLDGRQLTNDEKADYLIQVWRQYQMCRPFAVKIAGRFATSPQKDYLCWTESVRKAKKNGHDVSLLESLVSAGLASVGATTANSERDFAAMRKRTNPTVAEVERFLQTFMGGLNTDANAMDKKNKLCQKARQVWQKGFGTPRVSGEKRKSLNWANGLRKKKVKASQLNVNTSLSKNMSQLIITFIFHYSWSPIGTGGLWTDIHRKEEAGFEPIDEVWECWSAPSCPSVDELLWRPSLAYARSLWKREGKIIRLEKWKQETKFCSSAVSIAAHGWPPANGRVWWNGKARGWKFNHNLSDRPSYLAPRQQAELDLAADSQLQRPFKSDFNVQSFFTKSSWLNSGPQEAATWHGWCTGQSSEIELQDQSNLIKVPRLSSTVSITMIFMSSMAGMHTSPVAFTWEMPSPVHWWPIIMPCHRKTSSKLMFLLSNHWLHLASEWNGWQS